jgi:hypothetical protein
MTHDPERQTPAAPGETARDGAQGRTEDADSADVRRPRENAPDAGAARPRTGGSGLANEIGNPDTDGKR